jgi:D-sedoheptulose 7-phosphate isomerase
MTKSMLDMGHTPAWIRDGIPAEEITAKLIADYANKGDTDAAEIYNVVGQKLGKALSILIDAFNPEKIVIGSIFVRSENLLRPSMEEVIEKEALIHSRRVCSVVPAATGEKLGDLASIMTACYEMGIEPVPLKLSHAAGVMKQYDRLFLRYPALKCVSSPLMEAFNEAVRTYRLGGKLLICGNGGSASDSDHITGELMKGFYKKRPLNDIMKAALGEKGGRLQGALPAIALTQHSAVSTAFLNDVDPYLVFAQQVLGYGRKNDLFIGISCSGNATNVINAVNTAKALGIKTVGLTGPNGGKLKDVCDIVIKVPGDTVADIQEHHLPVYHTLCAMLEEEFFE